MLSPSSGIHPAMKTSACTFPTAAWKVFRQPGHQVIAPGLLAVASVRATVFRDVPAGTCSSMIRRSIPDRGYASIAVRTWSSMVFSP
jgi:hypothetical protein